MRFYTAAPRPIDEAERQRAVNRSGFLDAANDAILADIVREAATVFGTPMAALSIVDRDRQYFPVETGIGTDQTSRAASFCAHAMLTPDQIFCVTDATLDDRFAGNPLVLNGPEIRFYLGQPVVDDDGQVLGALCVLDTVTRSVPDPAAQTQLKGLVARVMHRAAELRGSD